MLSHVLETSDATVQLTAISYVKKQTLHYSITDNTVCDKAGKQCNSKIIKGDTPLIG